MTSNFFTTANLRNKKRKPSFLRNIRDLVANLSVMRNAFSIGDFKEYEHTVSAEDIAKFETGVVHEVYSTFALARDAEWSGRLFVLEMKNESEEGIGTGINIIHRSPAFLGESVRFVATLVAVNKNEVVTDFVAMAGERLIAKGTQWQKILPKEKLEKLFAELK